MFERFTPSAIKAMMQAQEEARRMGHNFVGTEQILLGLLAVGEGTAHAALTSFGLTLKQAREEALAITGRGSGVVAVEIPFTPRAKRVIELSWDEARQLGSNHIDSGHVLLGLLREGQGVADRILENLGIDKQALRAVIIEALANAAVPGLAKSILQPKREEPKTSGSSMFANFSDSSVRSIMAAQHIATELNLADIGEEALLYGFLSDGENAAAQLLANFSVAMDFVRRYMDELPKGPQRSSAAPIDYCKSLNDLFSNAARMAASKVEPEFLLRSMVYMGASRLGRLLQAANVDVSAFHSAVRKEFKHLDSAWKLPDTYGAAEKSAAPQPPEAKPAAKPRTLNEWFTEPAIRIVAQAQDRAKTRGASAVSTEDLLNELVSATNLVPPSVTARLQAAGEAAEQTQREQPATAIESEMELSSDVLSVFLSARNEARNLGLQSIGPEHLLLALFKSAADGQFSLCLDVDADTYRQIKDAVAKYLKEHVNVPSHGPEQTPLIVDETHVRATTRLVHLMKAAEAQAATAKHGAVQLSDLLLALIDEAQNSEVTFVKNRERAVLGARERIEDLSSAGKVTGKDFSAAAVLHRAAEHAKRLCSRRLDINHLALALLEQDDPAVDIAMSAVEGTKYARRSLRMRLEQCLIWQSYQSGHQDEPGEIIELTSVMAATGSFAPDLQNLLDEAMNDAKAHGRSSIDISDIEEILRKRRQA